MEGATVFKVCEEMEVSCIQIRSVSRRSAHTKRSGVEQRSGVVATSFLRVVSGVQYVGGRVTLGASEGVAESNILPKGWRGGLPANVPLGCRHWPM